MCKKLPFPKGTSKVTCYLLKDGIGFSFDVTVRIGDNTKSIRSMACLRTGKNMLDSSYSNWFFDAYVNHGSNEPYYIDVNEVMKIYRVNYWKNTYQEDFHLAKFLGSRGESIHVYFEKGYSMEGTDFGNCVRFGQVWKCHGEASTCDQFISGDGVLAFDVTIEDMKGAKR